MWLRARGAIAVASLALPAGVASADQPACFPERAVLQTTALQDAAGRVIGSLRNGKQVAVVGDHLRERGRWAEIAIKEPVELRAFVERRKLTVFLGEDYPVEAGRTWWMAGAPMKIGSGDAKRAEVMPDESVFPVEKIALRCTILTGSMAGDRLMDDTCHCAVLPEHREPAGTFVWWKNSKPLKIDSGDGRGIIDVHYDTGAGLIERREDQVLIEVLEPLAFLRVRRWVPAAGMKTGPSGYGRGMGSLCDELDLPLGQRGAALDRAVPLRAAPDADPFATLPPGTAYRVLDVRGADVDIVARWPGWALQRYTLDVRGWVPAAMLPAPADVRPQPYAIVGHVVLAPGIDAGRLRTITVRTDRHGEPVRSARVAPDGRFHLELEKPPSHAVGGQEAALSVLYNLEARSPTGDLVGAVRAAPSLPGGADDVTITVSVAPPDKRGAQRSASRR